MASRASLDRRSFLKSAGLTALASSVPLTAAPAELAGSGTTAASRYDFDAVPNRFGTDCTKYDQQLRVFGPGSVEVGMGIADMDFTAAPAITAAIKERLAHENWGYLDMPRGFSEEIAAWNKRRYGIDIDPDTLVISSGVHPALIATLQTFSPPGSRVLLQTPTYNGFYTDLRYSRTLAAESPLKVIDGRYSMDFADFERRIGQGDVRTFILCNPQNPTGNCWSPDDLTRVGEICLRRGVIVLADEIHCDFVNKGQKYTPFASLPDRKIVNNSLTFKAASKSFGLAAHKVGWFYSTNPDLLAKVKAYHRADISTLGVVANRGAMKSDDWLDQCVDYIDGTHDMVEKFIAERMPSVKYVKPEGTYLAWLDVTRVADRIDAKGLADAANRSKAVGAPDLVPEQMIERHLVKHARVHLNQGASYGVGGANHMRMNIATSRAMVAKALTSMANALERV